MSDDHTPIEIDASLLSDDALTGALSSIAASYMEADDNSDEQANLRDAGRVLSVIAFDRGLIDEWLCRIAKEQRG